MAPPIAIDPGVEPIDPGGAAEIVVPFSMKCRIALIDMPALEPTDGILTLTGTISFPFGAIGPLYVTFSKKIPVYVP